MAIYVQYGKVGKPILYSTLPTASADLNGIIGQVGDNVYQCDGTQWVALASPANLQDKSVTITQNGTTEITADSGYDGMSKATITTNVPSIPTEEKTVALDMASGNQVITPTSGKVLSKVTITKPSTMLATNIKKDVNIGGVVGTYEGVILPTYNGLLRFAFAPTISLSNSTLTITAVDNATSYAIYSDNTLLTTITTTSVDLSTYFTEGIHTIYAIAKATGYVDSEKSNEVSYEVEKTYSLMVRYSGQFNQQLGSRYGGILVGLNSSNPDIALEVKGNIIEYRSPNKVDNLPLTPGTGTIGQDSFANVGYVTIMATGANAAYAFNGGNLTPVRPEPTVILLPEDSQLEIFVYYVL